MSYITRINIIKLNDPLEKSPIHMMRQKVHNSQFALGNSTPSLGELVDFIFAVRLLIGNLLGSKSTLIRGLPGIADSSLSLTRGLLPDSLQKSLSLELPRSPFLNLSFLTVTHRLSL
ncbi:hypothetical protein TNCV_1221221 [Trichonephila clavipes]|nr:hypothetical protein TNCV_1221221 [Trichonephila clavipes]